MSDPAEVPIANPLLETVGLTCERDWHMLFERLGLHLATDEMLQVVDPNGSGKTSLLRLLSELTQLTAGEVRLNGRPLAKQRSELTRSLLWTGHAAGVKGLLSIEENLTWLCALHQPASREAIWQTLADVGLRGFEGVPCHTLSAGQQRHVALARLYLDAPPLWILDKPFTAFDKQGATQLEAYLAGHCQCGGMVVPTTHHSPQQVPVGYHEPDLGALKTTSDMTVKPALDDPA